MKTFRKLGFFAKRTGLFFAVLCVMLSAFLTTCDMAKYGLGNKVDINPPDIVITAPGADAYVRGTFAFGGTATDDMSVASVQVTAKSSDGLSRTFAATVSGETWNVDLKTATNAQSGEIPDGRTELIATVTDASGKTRSQTIFVNIDNVPPLVLVNAPSSYGSRTPPRLSFQTPLSANLFTIEGKTFDRYGVAESGAVTVRLLDKNKTVVATKTARGGSSWSIRFEFGPGKDAELVNKDIYFYDVQATDRAGNTSNFYYQAADIWDLMINASSSSAVEAFPTGEELSLIQSGDSATETKYKINAANLATYKLSPQTFMGDFKYDGDAKNPTVYLTNVDNSGGTYFGSGAPIVGYIQPGASKTSPLNPASVKATITNQSTGLSFVKQSTSVGGLVKDIDTVTIGDTLNFFFKLEQPDGHGNMVSLTPGMYKIEMSALDFAGNKGTNTVNFFLDNTIPVFKELDPPNLSYVGAASNTAEVLVTVDDDTGIPDNGLTAKAAFSSTEEPSTACTVTYVSSPTSTSKKFKVSVDVPAGKTQLVLALWATDKTSLVSPTQPRMTKYTATYIVDRTAPNAPIITDPVENSAQGLGGLGVIVKGTATDDIGVDSVLYWYTDLAGAIESDTSTWLKASIAASPSLPTGVVWERVLELNAAPEKLITFKVMARDKAGNKGPIASRSFWNDKALPDLKETGLGVGTAYQKGNFTLSGTVADSNGIDTLNIFQDIPVLYSAPPPVSSPWTYTINVNALTHADDGTKNYRIEATDKAGRKATIERRVTVDTQAPVVNFLDPKPAVKKMISGVETLVVNGSIKLQGNAADNNTITKLEHRSKSGANAWTAWQAFPTELYNFVLDINTTTLTDNANYSVEVRATDVAGNEATAQTSMYVDQSSDLPVIRFNGLDPAAPATSNLILDSAKLQGWAEDDDGAVASVKISVDVLTTYNPVSAPPVAPSTFFEHDLSGLSSGLHSLTIQATDINGKVATSAVLNFYIDRDRPAVTISSPANGGYKSDGFTMNGTASDSNGLKKADFSGTQKEYVEISTDNGTSWTKVEVNSGAWSFAVPASFVTTGGDGARTIKLRAFDSFNRETAAPATLSFNVDLTAPTLAVAPAVNTALGGWLHNTAVSLSGTASDSGVSPSGIARVEYRVNSTLSTDPWTALIGTTTWTGSATIANGAANKLELRAVDTAGNASAIKTYNPVKVDDTPPSLAITAPATVVDSKTAIAFSGSISDNLALDGTAPLTVQRKKNGAVQSDVAVTPSSGAWSYTQAANAITHADDGYWELGFVAKDSSGQTTTIIKTFTIDTTAPVLTVNLPVDGDKTTSASYTISGTARDETGGVGFDGTDDVEYSMNGGAWTALTLSSMAWSQPITLSAEGSYELRFRSTDKLGNQSAVITRTLYRDMAPPSLSETMLGSEDTKYTNVNLTLGGSVSDSYVLNKLELSVDNGAATPINAAVTLDPATDTFSTTVNHGYSAGERIMIHGTTMPTLASGSLNSTVPYYVRDVTATSFKLALTSGGTALDLSSAGAGLSLTPKTWSYLLDVNAALFTEGSHSLVFTATDGADRTTSLTRRVFVDKTAPTLSGITDLSTGWNGSTSYTMNGAASDGGSGSGVQSVEYSLDGTVWNAMNLSGGGGGSWNFSGAVAFQPGDNNLRFRAADRAGNVSLLSTQTVRVDTANPTISLNSPSGAVYVNGGSALTITFDCADAESGVAALHVKLASAFSGAADTGNAAGSLASGSAASGRWSASVSAAALMSQSNGNLKIYARVKDNAGNISLTNFDITVDKTAPTVGFGSPANLATVNKTINLSGTGGDNHALNSVKVEVQTAAAAWTTLDTFSGTTGYNWSIANLDTTNASYSYDADSGSPGQQLALRATATDMAGNTTTDMRMLTVDQNSDRPIVKLSNLPTFDGSTTLKMTKTVYGSISDDDGTPANGNFRISQNGTTWTNVVLSDGTWQYDVTGADGAKTLYFQVTDQKGTFFETTAASALSKVYVTNQDASVKVETAIQFKVDTVTPEIGPTMRADRASPYDFAADANTLTLTNNTPFGGPSSSFSIEVLAQDANGIASVSVEVPGLSGSPFAAIATGGVQGTYAEFRTGAINIGSLSSGQVTLTIKAKDNSGLESQATRIILVDNLAPTVIINSPEATRLLNGAVKVMGSASDGGSGLDTVNYSFGQEQSGPRTWTAVSNTVFNWEFSFTNIQDYAGKAVSISGSTVTQNAHGYANGTKLWFSANNPADSSDTRPQVGGVKVSLASPYYVVGATADTFGLAATSGGPALNFSSPGSFVYLSKYSTDGDNNSIWDLLVIIRARDKAGNESDTNYTLKVDPNGDRPLATVIYPNPANTNRTMGGTIRIQGSAEDDDGVAIVYMQIDETGNFNAPYSRGGKDWYNGGEGQPVTGAYSWNQTINANDEFNPESGSSTRTIYFRVRARDTVGTGLLGPWSATYTIVIDKNVPKIGSTNALTLKQYSGSVVTASRPYTDGMWIKGEWYLTGSVEDESDIDSINLSGNISGSLTTPDWFSSAVYPSLNKGYEMKIPVGSSSGTGSQKFTITAKDKSEPSLTSSIALTINYDNTAPLVNALQHGGANIDTTNWVTQSNYSYNFGSTISESDSGFERLAFYFRRDGTPSRIYDPMLLRTDPKNRIDLSGLSMVDGLPRLVISGATRPGTRSLSHSSLINNSNVRRGGLIKIGGIDRLITNYTPVSGTVEWADEVAITDTTASIAYAQVVDNMQIETPNTTYNAAGYPTVIARDDGDGMVESIERSGGTYTWSASINSKNIPDGPIVICYVAYDKAGNYVTGQVTSKVQNNGPRLAKATLGTDLNGNGTIEAGEKVPPYSALDPDGKTQTMATIASSAFKAKGQTSVEIDVTGGNGQLQYRLNVGGTSIHPLSILRATEAATVNTIIVSLANFATIGDGDKSLVFEIWDSTEETVVGTNSQSAQLTAPMKVMANDSVGPKAVIKPFYWNSATDNSLYGNSKANGHIELKDDLPNAVFAAANGLFDKDPKVSGKISIRGTAYDDQRLTELWAKVEDFTFTALPTQTVSAVTGMVRLATYSAGVWTVTAGGDMATRGWAFTVSDNELGQDGHRVKWQLDWDSSKVTNVAALDRTAYVVSKDRGNNEAAATITGTSADPETLYNNPSYRMDVVPYITAIQTTDRTNGGLKDQNIRSSDGRYSIMKGTGAGFITVSGFNLNPNEARIVNQSTVASATMTSGNAIAYSGVNAAKTSFSLSNNNNNSGYLEVFTGGIRALNNINANDAKGVYTGSDAVQMYNREADPYMRKNLLLNDDRYLRFFSMKGTAVKNGYYPDMLMEGNDPVFGYVNLTGGPNAPVGTAAATGAGSYYPSHAMPQRAKFNGSTAAEMYTEYLIKASIWDQMAMARDAGGRYIQASVYNRDTCSMSLIYDRYAELYTNGMGWGSGVTYSTYSGNKSDDTGNNAITLESVNQGLGLLLGRYQYPKLIAKGNSITGNAQIYMLYYDDNTAGRDLIFRNFRIGTSVALGNQLFSGGTSSTGGGYAQYSNLADGDTAGRLTAASDASKYFDLAVTSDNRIIVLYYDEGASRLKLRYSLAAVDGSSPNTLVTWFESPILFPDYVGTYVSMTLDSANGIHISAFDASDADLKYMYIPAYDSATLNTVTVDAAFSVGSWTKIKVRETGGTIVPYISYFNNTESGTRESIKLAYCKSAITAATVPAGVDATGNTTGNWECLTVPAITPPQGGSLTFKQVCLDFDTAGRPVLGYLGTNLEFGSWLVE